MHVVELNIGSWTTPVVGGGWITANPLLDNVGLVKERSDRSLFILRKKLTAPLTFTSNEYVQLLALKTAGYQSVDIRISNNSVVKFEGLLMLYGDFDDNKKVCLLETIYTDAYNDLLKNGDIEVNALSSSIQTCAIVEQSSIYLLNELPCFTKAQPESEFRKLYDPDGNISADPLNTHPDWSFFIHTGDDDTECPAGFTRHEYTSTYISFEIVGEYEEPELDFFQGLYMKAGLISQLAKRDDLDRFRLGTDVIEAILLATDSTVNFDINTYSDYFKIDYPNLEFILIADKSDIKRIGASNPAKWEITSFNDWMFYYRVMFGLEWLLDSGDFKFKRADSFTSPVSGNDISTYINNLNHYQTSADNKFSRETWTFEYSPNLNFRTSVLDYETFSENTQAYNLENINNNITDIINNPDDYQDSGFVFVATTDQTTYYEIINQTFPDPFQALKNYEFAAEKLVEQHNAIDRPFPNAKQDGNSVTLTPRPDEGYIFSGIPIYDIDDINFDKYVITGFGNMIIDSLEVSLNGADFAKIEGRI